MSSQKVLLLGATGQTGGSILNGLLKHGGFEVEALVRPASAEKPDVAKLKERGVKIRIGDISGPTENLVKILQGFDTVISAIDAGSQLAQISLATAAKEAGIKRFVPCGFITICPPKGVLTIRDQKEDVYNHIKKINLPYTFIDVGYWHQLSFPTLPSGKVDYAALRKPTDVIHSDGKAPNLLTDLRDVGTFVARIVSDERTLNKQVVTWGDELSENEIYAMMEEVSGEKLTTKNVSAEETTASAEQLTKLWIAEPSNVMYKYGALISQYDYSEYVRVDNTLEKAKYLGYLDARELYPDLKPISFRDFLKELLEGTIVKPYANLTL